MPQDAAPSEVTEAPKERPVYRNQLGAVEMAIWAHKSQTNDGRGFTKHTITFGRNYRDERDGQWKKTQFYDLKDLGCIVALAFTAMQFLMTDSAT